MSSLDPPPPLRRTSSSVFDPPHPLLRIQPVIVEPKPFREFKAHDTLSPTVLLNPSFEGFNLGGGESSTKGRREFVDLASQEVEREGESWMRETSEGGKERSDELELTISPPLDFFFLSELDDWTNKEIEDVSVCCLSGGTGGELSLLYLPCSRGRTSDNQPDLTSTSFPSLPRKRHLLDLFLHDHDLHPAHLRRRRKLFRDLAMPRRSFHWRHSISSYSTRSFANLPVLSSRPRSRHSSALASFPLGRRGEGG